MRSGPRVLSLPRTARSSTFEPAASSGPAAEERDELAPFWIELHAIPHAERGPHRAISNWRRSVQRLVELFRTASCSPMPSESGRAVVLMVLFVPSTESRRPTIPRRVFALGAEFAAITGPG